MKNAYLTIEKHRNGYIVIEADICGRRTERMTYLYYSLREAERKFRRKNGLKGKHLQKIIYQ